MSKRKLPENLFAAYDWTDSAGELDELASLRGAKLKKYVRESVENAENYARDLDKDNDVFAEDLFELALWLHDEE